MTLLSGDNISEINISSVKENSITEKTKGYTVNNGILQFNSADDLYDLAQKLPSKSYKDKIDWGNENGFISMEREINDVYNRISTNVTKEKVAKIVKADFDILVIAMKWLFSFALLIISISVSAKQFTVSGYIFLKETNETLISANCTDTITGKTTISNANGFYSLTLNEGKVCIKAKYIGCHSVLKCFDLKQDTLLNIYLAEKNENVGEIVITAKTSLQEQTLLGKETMLIEEIRTIPTFIGEADIMKAITSIPGVSLGREGRSDIYVRGGDRGQNLILLDGAKLYNTNHIGGFFSLFNPSIVKQVDVYKGGFPARYGGRASSVIDIYVRDGNKKKIESKFNLGLLSSGASFEGPIGEKLTFVVAARTSYFDLYTIPSLRKLKTYGEGEYFTFRFHDINAKLSYHIDQRNKIFVNFFSGSDLYKNISKTKTSSKKGVDSVLYNIDNYCITIGSNNSLSEKVFFKSTATYSIYNNQLTTLSKSNYDNIVSTNSYKSISRIKEINVRNQIEYYQSTTHSLKAGIEFSNYQFLPGQVYSYSANSATGYLNDTTTGYFSNLMANEIDVYGEDDIGITPNLFLNIGLRGILYSCKERNYYKLEPRLSFRAKINEHLSAKANYTIMNQFNHVIISNFGIFEKEMWIASTKNIPPQQAYQFSTGLFSTLKEQKLDLSVEVYYKKMKNLLEYKMPSSADIVITDLDKLLVKGGIGSSYGVELGARWTNKNLSTDMCYIISWNNRQFAGLNNGKWYPFIYDRRHNFSCLLTYAISSHYSISSNFVFSTGTPYTLPEGYIKMDDYSYGYFVYTGINNKRLPNHHRLDISLTKKEKTKKGNIQTFNLNIYNAYAHQNPLMIYYDQNSGKVYQKSMFTIIPTISYSIEF